MISNEFTVGQEDAKVLRHEKALEIAAHDDWLGGSHKYHRQQKIKRILATISNSNVPCKESDHPLMDLSNKEQETCQLMRVMHQARDSEEEPQTEGYWIYHKNNV